MIGVTPETAPAIEAHTRELLAALEAHFAGAPLSPGCEPVTRRLRADGAALRALLQRRGARRGCSARPRRSRCHWIERMNHPDVDSFGPLSPGDALAPTLPRAAALAARDTVPLVLDTVRAFETWVDSSPVGDGELPRGVGTHAGRLRGIGGRPAHVVVHALDGAARAGRPRALGCDRARRRRRRAGRHRLGAAAGLRAAPSRRAPAVQAVPRDEGVTPEGARDGTEDPLHHHRPAALRRARLQRRHDRAHAGRRSAGRHRHQLPARVQPERGLHAGALDDAHRTVRAHARRRSPTASRCRPMRRAWRRTSHEAGYRTALLGKAHFEPAMDMRGRWFENRMAREGSTGPCRGFEHMELAMHVPLGRLALLAVAPARASRRPERLRAAARRRTAAATPAHRRSRTTRSRASGTTPTGWPTAPSPGSTRSPPTTTGSCG